MADWEDEKLVLGPVLGFVGGFLILVYGVYEAYLGYTLSSISSLAGLPVSSLGGVVTAGVAGGVLGILIMGLAVGLWISPESHAELGIFLVLLSVASLVSVGGGGGIGLLLGVLGGTCGIAFGPEDSEPYPPDATALGPAGSAASSAAPSADWTARYFRACPSCHRVAPISDSSCHYCGAILSEQSPPPEVEHGSSD
jgi:hypothetical protein